MLNAGVTHHGVEMMAANHAIWVVAVQGWAWLLLGEEDLCGHVVNLDEGCDSIVWIRLRALLSCVRLRF